MARIKLSGVSLAVRSLLRITSQRSVFDVEGDPQLVRDLTDGHQQVIFLMWHNRLAGVTQWLYRQYHVKKGIWPLACLISPSGDGELLAYPLHQMGIETARGSSSRRGAKAVREAVTKAERGFNLATVGDGPKGPRYVLKEGPAALANHTGLPVLPISWSSDRTLMFRKAWDRMMIPLPGAHVRVRLGELFRATGDVTDDTRELQARLDALTPTCDDATTVGLTIPSRKR